MSWFGSGWKKRKLTAVKQIWNNRIKKYEDVTKPVVVYHYAHCDTERFAAIEPNENSKHRVCTIWKAENKSWVKAGFLRFPANNSSFSLSPLKNYKHICPSWK